MSRINELIVTVGNTWRDIQAHLPLIGEAVPAKAGTATAGNMDLKHKRSGSSHLYSVAVRS